MPAEAFFTSPYGPARIPNTDLLSWMFDSPAYPSDRKILVDAHDPCSYLTAGGAKTLIAKITKGLHEAGLKKGDCVLVHSFNSIYYPALVLGIISAGGVFTGTNPASTPAELSHHITTAAASFFISEPEIFPRLAQALSSPASSFVKERIWILDQRPGQAVPAGLRSWRALLEKGEEAWERFDDEEMQGSTTAMRLFSSGTTGLPKAVEVSHRSLVAEHAVAWEWDERAKDYEASFCWALPMFHAAIAPMAHTGHLRSGWTAYILRRFDLELFLSTVQRFQVTELLVVPTILTAIVMSPLTANYDLTSLRTVQVGAAPCSKEMQTRFKALMAGGRKVGGPEKGGTRKSTGEGSERMTQVWGMTETCCIGTRFYHPEDDDTGSIGRLVPGVEAKLVNEAGADISAYGVPGELCVRGPTLTRGYFRSPAANALAFDRDGFFHTGDIVYCDGATTKWYIVDRAKELIKVRGFQVAPAELEGVLLQHPLIVEAAVVGVVDHTAVGGIGGEGGDEAPRAYVVRRPGTAEDQLGEREVVQWAAERLARYKRITGGVRFIDAIPKTGSGKLLKKQLREWAKEEMDTGVARAKL